MAGNSYISIGSTSDVPITVVNDLNGTESTQILSANMGKVLNDSITQNVNNMTVSIVDHVSSYNKISPISAEVGKILNTELTSSETTLLTGLRGPMNRASLIRGLENLSLYQQTSPAINEFTSRSFFVKEYSRYYSVSHDSFKIYISSDGKRWSNFNYITSGTYNNQSHNTSQTFCYSPQLNRIILLTRAIGLYNDFGSIGGDWNATFKGGYYSLPTLGQRKWSTCAWSPILSKFCAVSDDGYVALSDTGLTTASWNISQKLKNYGQIHWSTIFNKFYVLHNTSQVISTSADGITWEEIPVSWPSSGKFVDVPELSKMILLRFDGTNKGYMVTEDGANFTNVEFNSNIIETSTDLYGTGAWISHLGYFIIFNIYNPKQLIISDNLMTWEKITIDKIAPLPANHPSVINCLYDDRTGTLVLNVSGKPYCTYVCNIL